MTTTDSPAAPAPQDGATRHTEAELLAADVQRVTHPEIRMRAAQHTALQHQQQMLHFFGELQ